MKQFLHNSSRSILIYGLILSIITYLLVSCEREKTKSDPTEFLSESSVIVPNLTGEWTWISTMTGGWGFSVINPETEGYTRSIIFTSQQNYIEITNNHISMESYYRIDSTKIKSNGNPIFKITYFDENKIPQYMTIDQNYDTICLYLSDINNCYDCSTTSIYRKY